MMFLVNLELHWIEFFDMLFEESEDRGGPSISITHSLLAQTRNQHDLVDCVDKNHVIGYLDAHSIYNVENFQVRILELHF
jgi:hypothetical protein